VRSKITPILIFFSWAWAEKPIVSAATAANNPAARRCPSIASSRIVHCVRRARRGPFAGIGQSRRDAAGRKMNQAGAALVLEAVALTLDADDGRMVQQPVGHGSPRVS